MAIYITGHRQVMRNLAECHKIVHNINGQTNRAGGIVNSTRPICLADVPDERREHVDHRGEHKHRT